jgi:hypothetical protein
MLLINIQHPIQTKLPTIIGKQTGRFQDYLVVFIQEATFHRLYAQGIHSLHYLSRNASYSAHL